MTNHSGVGPEPGAKLRVLITGAGGGIGYACARAFAEQGAELILSDIDGPTLKRAVESFGGHGRLCDVASESSVKTLAAEVLKIHASLDVLINAAGRGYVRNLGTLRITRAFLPMMKGERQKKDIVNISPMDGLVSKACHFPYAASQEAFDRLSQAFSETVRGSGIGLITVVPSSPPERPRQGASSTDLAALRGDPNQVAAAVVAAVQSTTSRPGEQLVLPSVPMCPGAASPVDALADSPRLRRSG